ncbi:putative ribonuclease H-like domain-containing protein [Tanacetum coccineum]|uniref:Ribonuclease H-like domain-containing protein n=1 Tax=Tanacetum coccineum TaxID=301880 RepID=A0ABQ5FDT5_9ASTR
MNYVPVVTGKQTNDITGTKDNIVTGYAQKEKELEQEYIIMPLCTTNPLISQGPKDSEGDDGMKPTEVDERGASDKNEKDTQDTRSESERLNQREMQSEHTNSINSINTVSTPVSIAGPSFDNVVPSPLVNTTGPSVSTANEFEEHLFERFSPFKNAFTLPPIPNVSSMDNTGIFGNAYDDEDLEEEVDMNSVISSYSDPDTSFTKFHKDHPEDQVIGSLKTHVQTRNMTKITEEHGLISSVTSSGEQITKIFRIDELLQFKLLKFWTLVDLPRDKLAIDYDEVFAPVARIEAIRLFLAYASFKDFVVYQMDMKSAFLYGKIEEEVYVCQPPGFEGPHFPDKVYKVEKALYRLHQAPREWYATLSTYLLDNGFHRGQIDKTLFIKRHKDDILLVKQKSDGIFISQDKYMVEILKKFNFASVKTASTLMETNKALVKDEEAKDVDVHLYRSLMYLTASRPDIMFAVCACARTEYVDAATASWTHVLWIQNQMLDYGFNFMNTKIYIDNESTICIVKNLVFHTQNQAQIRDKAPFHQDCYKKNLIKRLRLSTTDHNVTDLPTKLSSLTFLIA